MRKERRAKFKCVHVLKTPPPQYLPLAFGMQRVNLYWAGVEASCDVSALYIWPLFPFPAKVLKCASTCALFFFGHATRHSGP